MGLSNGNGYVERNARIVELHVRHGKTLTEIGEMFDLTRERVRQIVRAKGVPPAVTRDVVRWKRYKRRIEWECEGCGKKERRTPGHARHKYCSHGCALANQAPRRKYTREDLREHLRKLAEEIGRTPGVKEMNEYDGPSHSTYVYRFGSIRAAQKAAGLEPNRPGGAGHVST